LRTAGKTTTKRPARLLRAEYCHRPNRVDKPGGRLSKKFPRAVSIDNASSESGHL
jgi:hypothetical protein